MGKPTIVAMGGGGFSMEPENPLLDDYILGLTGKVRPRVCFLPTASGDSEEYIERFRESLGDRAETAVLQLFRRSVPELESFIATQDVLYVGGGNTANMLAIWRAHGLDQILRRAWLDGIILCGISAGAICWFEGGVTDSFGDGLKPLRRALGFLPGSFCPHYDGEALRRPTFEGLVRRGELPGGWAADDGVALHFEGRQLAAIVSSRASGTGWRIDCEDGEEVSIRELPTTRLEEAGREVDAIAADAAIIRV